MTNKNQISSFGINFDTFTMNEALNSIQDSIKQKKNMNVVVVNAATVVMCIRDSKYCNLVNSASMVLVDGMPVLWSLRALGFTLSERVCGPDLFQNVLRMSDKNNFGIYFLGARKSVLMLMVKKIKKKYPNISITGLSDGYFKVSEEEGVLSSIIKSNPKILFIGMPSPEKEKIMNKLISNNICSIGVGGVFDIEAGIFKRAPSWIQNIGLEWLFRLVQEPRRLLKRYFIVNILFIFYVFKEFLNQMKQKGD